MIRPSFTGHGAPRCETVPNPSIFFAIEDLPYDADNATRRAADKQAAEAKRECAKCPYLAECLGWAMENPDESGVWGATTDRERKRMRRVAVQTRVSSYV